MYVSGLDLVYGFTVVSTCTMCCVCMYWHFGTTIVELLRGKGMEGCRHVCVFVSTNPFDEVFSILAVCGKNRIVELVRGKGM